MPSEHTTRRRRRGVRASRSKLVRALGDAGLRTQSALAERIADMEGLEQAPRDLVSRVFREQPVDPLSLERVARALGVPAYTLYRTSDEVEPEATPGTDGKPAPAGDPAADAVAAPPAAAPARARRLLWSALGAVAAGVLVAVVTILSPGDDEQATDGPVTPPADALADRRALLLPAEGPVATLLAEAFGAALEATGARVVEPTTALLPGAPAAPRLVRQFGADAAFELQTLEAPGAFWVGATLYGHRGGERALLWSGELPLSSADRHARRLAASMTRSAQAWFAGMLEPWRRHQGYIGPEVQRRLWRSLAPLSEQNELSVKRAISHLQVVIESHPRSATAHAGLCQAWMAEYRRTRDGRWLEPAATACARAMDLAPASPWARVAQARLLRHQGRHREALAMAKALLEEDPELVDGWIELAENELALFRVDGSRQAPLDEAIASLDRVARSAGTDWRAWHHLARIHYFSGRPQEAIAAAEKAVALHPSESTFNNLATYHQCMGNFDAAVTLYQRSLALQPGITTLQNLGAAQTNSGRHEEATATFRRVIRELEAQGIPGYHVVWANLAENLHRLGRDEEAADAYIRAAERAEAEMAAGEQDDLHRASLVYYYSAVEALSPERVPPRLRRAVERQLAELATRPPEEMAPITRMRMIQVWHWRGENARARALLGKAEGVCPGFTRDPTFDELRRPAAGESVVARDR